MIANHNHLNTYFLMFWVCICICVCVLLSVHSKSFFPICSLTNVFVHRVKCELVVSGANTGQYFWDVWNHRPIQFNAALLESKRGQVLVKAWKSATTFNFSSSARITLVVDCLEMPEVLEISLKEEKNKHSITCAWTH